MTQLIRGTCSHVAKPCIGLTVPEKVTYALKEEGNVIACIIQEVKIDDTKVSPVFKLHKMRNWQVNPHFFFTVSKYT